MAILKSGVQARRVSISEVHDVVKGFGLRKSDDSTRLIPPYQLAPFSFGYYPTPINFHPRSEDNPVPLG